MPPSQLKRLKASLREQGITGPQKSKKDKKNNKGDNADQRAKKHAALTGIRESFNPFEFKAPARPNKFEVTTNRPTTGKAALRRPGVARSNAEELRRKTLLPELHSRNKVGGILDRRIGENDPTMTLDDKMMARFTREQQKKKGVNVFDLEEAEDEFELTHGGGAMAFEAEDGKKVRDDYDAASIGGSDDEGGDGFLRRKRARDADPDAEGEDGEDGEEGKPERKKSKAEVMKEVIAKSKFHKYERQQAKEDDDDLREELDKDLPDILAALRGTYIPPPPRSIPPPQMATESAEPSNNGFSMNADRAAMLAGNRTKEQADKEYDVRVRQMLQDQRAKPTERTKTEEEKVREEANRLKELEQKRLRRMQGEEESESEEEEKKDEEEDEESDVDDARQFGLAPSVPTGTRPEGVDDEDDFIMDDDLLASDSEADISDDSGDESGNESLGMDDEDDEFLKDVLPESSKSKKKASNSTSVDAPPSGKLAYTYPCPESHEELLEVLKDVPETDIPVVVQRIRALYHPGLHHTNKQKLCNFSTALVDHISYMANQKPAVALTVVENVIRHVHSLSRIFPEHIATRFRHHLKLLQASNDPTPGDLALLTAIGTIYPTSDHFHQVVTPAITLMARWMGLTTPVSAKDIATGAYIGALCIKYQTLSKRYIPELVRYTNLCLSSPHTTPSLLKSHTTNLLSLADLWSIKSAFAEIFTPTISILKANPSLTAKRALQHLQIHLSASTLSRRPLELHHHRPLPIKSNIPKFEENFDPTKHYDPDKERAEAAKLRKEYKREKKGAMRELRKDTQFVAREQLKEKKERDRAYEQKYKRLVAEIQGEEGREKNAYAREKEGRQRKKARS